MRKSYKKQQEETHSDPISQWEEVWGAEEYIAHEADFQKIFSEFQELRKKYSVIATRWYWLEKQGAVKIKIVDGKPKLLIVSTYYQMYSCMFSKFCEWLSFKEAQEIKNDPPKKIELEKTMSDIKNRLTGLNKTVGTLRN
jgi:hypothetical protein